MPQGTKRKRAETKLVKAAVSRLTKKARTIARGTGGRNIKFGFKNLARASKLGEWKFFDSEFDGVGSSVSQGSTTPQIRFLNNIATGTDVSNRIGRQINIRRLTWYMTVQSLVGTVYPTCRAFICYDKQSSGTTAAYTDVIKDPTAGVTGSMRPFGMINLNNRERFIILKNYFFMLNERGDTGAFKAIKGNWKGNLPTVFQNTGNTAADIASGALLLMMITDQPTDSNGAVFRWIARIRFTDA